ncbi:MAG: hypothetical protein FJX86_04235, partial [Bacteroidetes bacterium]|nr:hypothetical protein [Bacteroidota bacterium]
MKNTIGKKSLFRHLLSFSGYFLLAIITIGVTDLRAQSNPSPGKAQSKAIWITGATIHDGVRAPYPGLVGFSNGRIHYVGSGAEIRLDATNSEIINASGQHLYPGFIAPHTLLGLYEIEAVRATRDHTETGSLN